MTARKEVAIYISGSVGSGKTRKAIELIDQYYKFYDIVIILKATPDFEEYTDFFDSPNFIISLYDDVKCLDLIEKKRKNKKFKKLRFLIVFDDCVGYMKQKILNKVFYIYRHLKTSLIFISQSFKILDNTFRNNLTMIYFMKNTDENFFNYFKKNVSSDEKWVSHFKKAQYPIILFFLRNGSIHKLN